MMADIHQTRVLDGLKSLFESRQYSDLTICCGTREFKVHRAIICQRSQFFAAACDGPFQEAVTRRIALEDDDPIAIESMISYMYNLDYDDETFATQFHSNLRSGGLVAKAVEDDATGNNIDADSHGVDSDMAESVTTKTTSEHSGPASEGAYDFTKRLADILLGNAQVYSIADKYDIPELKKLAKSKFKLKGPLILGTGRLEEILRTVYESTPSSDRGLRDIVCLAIVKQMGSLVSQPDFNDILRYNGDFAVDIFCLHVKTDSEKLDQMTALNIATEAEIDEVRAKLESVELERDQQKETIDRIATVVNRYDSCRHCNAGFNGCLEMDNSSRLTLRCGECRTKHR